jgi:hypothetical protein
MTANPLYREEPCKTALNQCKGMPFRWTLGIERGGTPYPAKGRLQAPISPVRRHP